MSNAIKILFVDDDSDISEVYAEEIRLLGHEVELACSADQALGIFKGSSFDLVITDVYMPGKDGVQLLQELKSIDPDLPVLMITGAPDEEKVLESMREHACDFLQKPVSMLQMEAAVNRAAQFTARMKKLRADREGALAALIKSEASEQAALEKADLIQELSDFRVKYNHDAKVSSVGTMAAGILHEINNPLSVILGFGNLLKSEKSLPERSQKSIEVLVQAANRIKDLSDGLLAFVHKDEEPSKVFSANESIEYMARIYRVLLEGDRVKLELDLCEGKADIWGNKTQFQSIVSNFLTNSRDAFKSVTDRAKGVTVSTKTQERGIEVIFSDNASGMPQEVVDNIFKPFFTTKSVGSGTGLGMSIVLDAVRNLNGQFSVDSKVGIGSTFKLFIPYERRDEKSRDPEGSIGKDPSQIESSQPKGHKAVIFEGDPLVVHMMEVAFGGHFEVEFTSEVETLLSMGASNLIGVAVIDFDHAECQDTDFVAKVASDKRNYPLIVLASHLSPGKKKFFKSQPGITVVPKPVDYDQLKDMISGKIAKLSSAKTA